MIAPDPDPLLIWTEAMLAGDFEAAWHLTDSLEAERRAGAPRQPWNLVWDGTPFDGRSVVIRCAHGLGDTIQSLRYASLLKRRARAVFAHVQPELRDLVCGMPGIDGLCTPEPDDRALEVECMELPYLFRTTAQTVPNVVPYLPVESIAQRYRDRKLSKRMAGMEIGLVWASGQYDPVRSAKLRYFEPLARMPGIRLHSLQQGPAVCELSGANFPVERLSQHTQEIGAAAAAMLQLDLILTVDSMTAHLAGALGCPVWTMLPHHADWRWMRHRADTPWYPTMRLFRQPAPHAWEAVIETVLRQLGQYGTKRTQIP